jgi:hypothetical protein
MKLAHKLWTFGTLFLGSELHNSRNSKLREGNGKSVTSIILYEATMKL